jgi:hypothetical protein
VRLHAPHDFRRRRAQALGQPEKCPESGAADAVLKQAEDAVAGRNPRTANGDSRLGRLGLSPVLMAACNSSGGVMGKMISLQTIAVAAAATGMVPAEEGKLFRFTIRHSVLLAAAIRLIVVFYAYVATQ